MSKLHQNSGGIGKSIPSALEISLGRRGWISQYLLHFGGERMQYPAEYREEMEDDGSKKRDNRRKLYYPFHSPYSPGWLKLVKMEKEEWSGLYKRRDFRTLRSRHPSDPPSCITLRTVPCPSATSLLTISPPRAFLHGAHFCCC